MTRTTALFTAAAAITVATASACNLADPSELWGSVPSATNEPDGGSGAANGGDASLTVTGLAIPGRGTPPSCAVDAGSVHPSELVSVAGGPFEMGCNAAVDGECAPLEKPQHSVTLADFSIDKTEVTQAQYALCLQAGKCEDPYCAWDPCGQPNLPATCVYRAEALAYCAFVGERLPTEAEWEAAARGTDGRKYPWGNEPLSCALANTDGCGGVNDVGSLPNGASPCGALDMVGNVVEWTLDVYDTSYYSSSPASDPQGPPATASSTYVGRGGGSKSIEAWDRASARDWYQALYVKDTMGFRCAK